MLLLQSHSYSMDRAKLAELAGKAHTSYAANMIMDNCAYEDSFFEFQYSDHCKCAIRAGKARTKTAAREIEDTCY